jgi:hypothetical protein
VLMQIHEGLRIVGAESAQRHDTSVEKLDRTHGFHRPIAHDL